MKAQRESSAPLKRVAIPQYGTYTSDQIQDLEHHFWTFTFWSLTFGASLFGISIFLQNFLKST